MAWNRTDGHVYVIESECGYHKIGQTVDMDTRLIALHRDKNNNTLGKMRYVHYFYTLQVDQWEKFFHRLFRDQRCDYDIVQGREWFNLTDADLALLRTFQTPVYFLPTDDQFRRYVPRVFTNAHTLHLEMQKYTREPRRFWRFNSTEKLPIKLYPDLGAFGFWGSSRYCETDVRAVYRREAHNRFSKSRGDIHQLMLKAGIYPMDFFDHYKAQKNAA
jgi:hypothetical protein